MLRFPLVAQPEPLYSSVKFCDGVVTCPPAKAAAVEGPNHDPFFLLVIKLLPADHAPTAMCAATLGPLEL